MRGLLLFLALFVPAFALLAIVGEKNLRRDLPSGEPTMKMPRVHLPLLGTASYLNTEQARYAFLCEVTSRRLLSMDAWNCLLALEEGRSICGLKMGFTI